MWYGVPSMTAPIYPVFSDWPWQHWASQRPDSTALLLNETPMSWLALNEKISQLAASFILQGVVPDAIVAVRGKNSAELLFAYLAVLQCGARVLPLNPQLPDTLLAELLPSLNVGYGYSPEADFCWPSPIKTLAVTPSDVVSPIRALPQWHSQRLATLTLTSGSTGMPKAAAHSFNAHLSSAKGVLSLMPLGPQDSWLLSLPLFHVSGQGIVWRWLLAGACLVVRNMRSLDDALRGCTHASLVPTQLWRLLHQPETTLTLKEVLLGGAMIPVDLTEQAEQRGIRCWCGYGLTEMASTVCAKRADALPGVGLPLPGREMKLQDDEILLRGDNMASGYWRDGQLFPLADPDGWFHTRDRGEMQNGELRIIGRLDNLFFSGGEGIQPEDVERVLLAHPQVQQVFVVPVDDREFGQRPVAVIEPLAEFDFAVLNTWVQGKLARFQQPVRYLRLPESLKNGGIKISRQAVLNWVVSQN
ncbi:o-succinylbenzoate--CoA ligase [Hafnia sp. HMSC23F03]|uniref:o-succinylbenzoate--CoA ligase n=1 Tax=Hafnia sp. HMSC23F03 TaxID=1581059 RepID=UPI0008A24CAB|nr:o-succinylbenzoate--CoA ligase [Hafnia sp. HMSC23F03]OFS08596.1 o-succinylbenzoate--CoA ligase [Hafnia sp. HMSC23F03]